MDHAARRSATRILATGAQMLTTDKSPFNWAAIPADVSRSYPRAPGLVVRRGDTRHCRLPSPFVLRASALAHHIRDAGARRVRDAVRYAVRDAVRDALEDAASAPRYDGPRRSACGAEERDVDRRAPALSPTARQIGV